MFPGWIARGGSGAGRAARILHSATLSRPTLFHDQINILSWSRTDAIHPYHTTGRVCGVEEWGGVGANSTVSLPPCRDKVDSTLIDSDYTVCVCGGVREVSKGGGAPRWCTHMGKGDRQTRAPRPQIVKNPLNSPTLSDPHRSHFSAVRGAPLHPVDCTIIYCATPRCRHRNFESKKSTLRKRYFLGGGGEAVIVFKSVVCSNCRRGGGVVGWPQKRRTHVQANGSMS